MSNMDIAGLIEKYIRQTLTEEERKRLEHWLDEHKDNRTYFESITAPGVVEDIAKALLNIDKAAIRRKFEKKRKEL